MFHLYSEYESPNGHRWIVVGINKRFIQILDINNGSRMDCAVTVARHTLKLVKKAEKSRYRLTVTRGLVVLTMIKEVQLHGTRVAVFEYVGIKPVHYVET